MHEKNIQVLFEHICFINKWFSKTRRCSSCSLGSIKISGWYWL